MWNHSRSARVQLHLFCKWHLWCIIVLENGFDWSARPRMFLTRPKLKSNRFFPHLRKVVVGWRLDTWATRMRHSASIPFWCTHFTWNHSRSARVQLHLFCKWHLWCIIVLANGFDWSARPRMCLTRPKLKSNRFFPPPTSVLFHQAVGNCMAQTKRIGLCPTCHPETGVISTGKNNMPFATILTDALVAIADCS